MKMILFLLVFILTSQVYATSTCFEIFAGKVAAVAAEPEPKPAEPPIRESQREPGMPIYSFGKRLTAEEIVTAIESGPALTKRLRLSEREMETLVEQTRQLLSDKSITDRDVFDALFAVKNKYFAKLEDRMKNFGQAISSNVRDMRKRRLQFAFLLKAGDPIQAATLYRTRFEAYYVSKSRILQYIESRKASRDEDIVSNSKFVLQGITEGLYFDLRKKVDQIYKGGRTPEVSEVLEIYDQVYARSNDEFRFIEFYIKETYADPTIDAKVKENLDYIMKRLSVNTMAQRLGLQMLSQAYMDKPQTTSKIEFGRPQILVWGLKESLKNQRWFNFTFALSAASQNIGLKLTEFIKPKWLQDGIRGLLMLNYNLYVLKMYLVPIESIITAPPQLRGPIFEGYLDDTMNSNYSKQLMETLARLSSDRQVWKELLTYVKQKSETDETYRVMYDQMKESELGIAQHGWISRFHETSVFDVWMGIGIRSTPIVTGAVGWQWDSIVTGYMHVQTAAFSALESGWAYMTGF